MNHILVTGIMRSGTTWAGKVIARHPGLSYLQEPFNRKNGIHGVEHWFPYCEEGDRYAVLVDDFLNGKFKYRKNSSSRDIWLTNLLKRLIGGKANWLAWEYKYLKSGHTSMLIKDPLASLLSGYMISRHNLKVICMVREPGAFYYSNKRLGWNFDLNNLASQEKLVSRYLKEEQELLQGNNAYTETLAILWRCIYKYFHRLSGEVDPNHLLFVRHEDLCNDPSGTFEKIFAFIGLESNDDIESYIRSTSSSDNITEAEGITHKLERDSSSLPGYWRDKVTSEEKSIISEYTDDVYHYFY